MLILRMLEAIKAGTDEDAPSAKYVGRFLVHRLSTGFTAILEFADEERVLLTDRSDISMSSGSVIVYAIRLTVLR
jgi:hypothetical protein